MPTPASLVLELERLKDVRSGAAAARKAELVKSLRSRPLPSSGLVARLHEALCFLRACPDDAAVLGEVEAALEGFASRPDLRRLRGRLADTGIAGTTTYYRFLLPMARWLETRHPGALAIEWSYVGNAEALASLLPSLVPISGGAAFDEYEQPPKDWLRLLRGLHETDAEWLTARVAGLLADEPSIRDALWASMQVGFALRPRKGGPSRTTARHAPSPVVYVRAPLDRSRPDIARELRRPPLRVRKLGEPEGLAILDLARAAMVARHRDLDAFSHGNPRDVRMVELGGGLQLACVGMLPGRRLLLEAVFGFLTLRNGVPIGYVLTSALFNSSEVAYNVFDTWRGGESAIVYGRVLATAAHLFRADTFAVDPYQLGHGNEEGLASGAWWFYQKLGFRPKDPETLRLMERELARMRAEPGHRSDRTTLRRLAAAPMYFEARGPREDVLGCLSVADVGARILRLLAGRFGSGLAGAPLACAREAAGLLGIPTTRGAPRGWSRDERDALALWAPLVLALPGLAAWRPGERRALAEVIRAKGGPDEHGYVRRFDAHARLRSAIVELQRTRLSDPAGRPGR